MSARVWFMVQLWFWWPVHFVLWECNLHAMQIISQKSACQVESGRKGIRNCSWCKLPSAPSWELGDPKTNLLTGACSMAPAHIGQGSRVTCIHCCILNEEFHNCIWLEDILKAVQNGCPTFIKMFWKLCKKQLSQAFTKMVWKMFRTDFVLPSILSHFCDQSDLPESAAGNEVHVQMSPYCGEGWENHSWREAFWCLLKLLMHLVVMELRNPLNPWYTRTAPHWYFSCLWTLFCLMQPPLSETSHLQSQNSSFPQEVPFLFASPSFQA